MKWEHREVLLAWNEEREGWISEETATQPELLGGSAVLAHYGADGWELVGVTVDSYEADGEADRKALGSTITIPMVTGWISAQRRFYFKRPKED